MSNIQYDQKQLKRISPRETEVASMAARGKGIKETAQELGLKSNYIQNLRASLFKKLSCTNITSAVTILKDRGLI